MNDGTTNLMNDGTTNLMNCSTTNLMHLEVTLSDFINFISSNAGVNILKSIFMYGIQNNFDKENLWKICLSQTCIQTGITFRLDDDNDKEGIIENVKTRLVVDNDDTSCGEKYYLFIVRKFETILNIIRFLSVKELSSSSSSSYLNNDNVKRIKTSVNFPIKLTKLNADVLATMIYQNAKCKIEKKKKKQKKKKEKKEKEKKEKEEKKRKKKKKDYTTIATATATATTTIAIAIATVWFSLADIHVNNNNNDDDNNNNNNSNNNNDNDKKEINVDNNNYLSLYLHNKKSKHLSQDKFKINGNPINIYEYDRNDIIAIHNFFSSSTFHKVHCCNPKHNDRNPSMHLYLKKNVWYSLIDKWLLTRDEIDRLQMEEDQAINSNMTRFRNFNIILFILSAHCFACNYHENFLTRWQLRQVLKKYYY
uniref:Wsv137-like protein n=1 Tax=Metapenaeus ensis majanivirus TaxID=2984279 RepID=A0A9C7EYP0_9VIRU|nr:MAG: wsv137-like protein [Metapenaeus ensis majanivirus]